MFDRKKRKTLKIIAGTSAVVAAGSVSAAVSSSAQISDNEIKELAAVSAELGQIEVSTRISAETNELEVVLKNTTSEPVTITHITPRVARVARGEFNFSSLLKDGSLTLETDESVTVALQHKSVSTVAATSPLHDVLKSTMSVITDSDSFASVLIVA